MQQRCSRQGLSTTRSNEGDRLIPLSRADLQCAHVDLVVGSAQGATLYAAAIESDAARQGYSSEEERQQQRQDAPHHSRSPHAIDLSEWNRLLSAPLVAAAGGGGSAMPGSCEATAADGSARPESTSKGKQENSNQQEQEQESEQ